MEALRCYSWPGNIRELQNVVERAVLLCAGDVIRPEYLSDLSAGRAGRRGLGELLRSEKTRRVRQALLQTGGNQAAAARLLGISRGNLNRLMKALGIRAERELQ
jgi:DNA-binding NtrC family response regulator